MRVESKDESWCWKLGRGVHNKYENLWAKHHKRIPKATQMSFNFNMFLHVAHFRSKPLEERKRKR